MNQEKVEGIYANVVVKELRSKNVKVSDLADPDERNVHKRSLSRIDVFRVETVFLNDGKKGAEIRRIQTNLRVMPLSLSRCDREEKIKLCMLSFVRFTEVIVKKLVNLPKALDL